MTSPPSQKSSVHSWQASSDGLLWKIRTNLLMPALVIVAMWFGVDPEMEELKKNERKKETNKQTEGQTGVGE